MKDYIELTVITTHTGSELIADMLSEYSIDGVAINDIQDVIDLEKSGRTWDYTDDDVYKRDNSVLIKCYIKKEGAEATIKEIKARLDTLKNSCPFELGTLSISTNEIDGDLWKEKWKENFKPIHIGENIVIVPEWVDYKAKNGEKIVYIGTDMAFGTGEHETTAMCIEILERYVKSGDTVIDVGCGSGILGITASKLGAKKVVMTDIDDCAIDASKKNCEINGVDNAQVLKENLLDRNIVRGDIIVCNIMAEVLIAFSQIIGGSLVKGGTIILSGILNDRKDKVIDAYTRVGYILKDSMERGEWSALVFSGTVAV